MKGFAQLTPREKRLLVGGGLFVIAIALWFYGWQPVAAQRDAQHDRIARYLALIDIAQRSPEPTSTSVPQCADGSPLAPRVTQSADIAGIPLARLDPEGPNLRITITDTRYADAIAWIARLESQDCIRTTAVEMARLTEPGKVSLRMTLEDAGT